jgi:hypothetical protein
MDQWTFSPLSFPIRRPRAAALKMAAVPTVDINHIPYYRATRSRRADSRPGSPPLRAAASLCSSSRFLSREFLRACLRARCRFHLFLLVSRHPFISTTVRVHEARTRIAEPGIVPTSSEREISRWRERSRDRVESTQRLRPPRITMAVVVKRLDTSTEGEKIHDRDT